MEMNKEINKFHMTTNKEISFNCHPPPLLNKAKKKKKVMHKTSEASKHCCGRVIQFITPHTETMLFQ